MRCFSTFVPLVEAEVGPPDLHISSRGGGQAARPPRLARPPCEHPNLHVSGGGRGRVSRPPHLARRWRFGFSTHASRAYLAYASVMIDFFLHESGFYGSRVSVTFSLCLYRGRFLLTWVRFFQHTCLGHIRLMPPPWWISSHMGFTDSCVSGTFGLCLRCGGFLLTRVEFSQITRLEHIWPMPPP